MRRRPQWLASLTQHGETPPYMLKFRSSDGFIIGTVALAVFTDMFLYGVIVPVIPFAMQTRSHVEESRVQYWVSVLIAIYGAALLVFSPVCGWIADRSSSRRSPLLIGLFALLGSTVLLNVASSIGLLIAGRILQGSSAAVVWVVGLALLADTVPPNRMAQSMGYVSLGMSLGILVAPLLGGVVFDYAGYNAVFGMSYALVGVDIVLRLLLVEKKVAARWSSQNVESEDAAASNLTQNQGDVEKTAALDSNDDPNSSSEPVQGAIQDTGQENSTPPTAERRLRDRLPPILSLLYSRRLLSALFCSILQAALLTSFDSVLTLHAAKSFGWTSTGAALLFLALVIPTFLAPLFGWVSDRYGGRYPASIGFIFACPPLVCLRFVDSNTISDKVLICALLALIGLFLSLTFPPLMAEISSVVEAKEKSMIEKVGRGFGPGGAYAQAYALFNVAFAAGCMLGPLLAGFVVQERGWATMAWVLGLLSGVTAFPAFLWLGGWVGGKDSRWKHMLKNST